MCLTSFAARAGFRTVVASMVFPFLAMLAMPAQAHFFARSYTLPIPFAMYAWATSAALVLSFVLCGLLIASGRFSHHQASTKISLHLVVGRSLILVVRALCLTVLALCILGGLLGTQSAYDNFGMTCFWIVFVLVVCYLVAVVGDFYALVNPWKTLVECLESFLEIRFTGAFQNTAPLGYWPAVLLYMSFIFVELFADLTPRGLSIALLAYTLINVGGAWLLGTRYWFRYGEFFAVFFGLVGKMAPLEWKSHESDPSGFERVELHGRLPFVGLLREKADHMSLVVFILFMLSSTGFDGLHGTLPWVHLFWREINPHIVEWLALSPRRQVFVSAQIFHYWQWFMLLLSPFAYLAVFMLSIAGTKLAGRSGLGVKELALRVCLTLIPIAFVYHLTHYFTLALSQGGQMIRLVSDPLGLGWNIFGSARIEVQPIMIDLAVVWHVQVGLILIGHIVSVYLAHLQAIRCFDSAWKTAISQLPMLLLMVIFTTMGLWILSLPLAPSN